MCCQQIICMAPPLDQLALGSLVGNELLLQRGILWSGWSVCEEEIHPRNFMRSCWYPSPTSPSQSKARGLQKQMQEALHWFAATSRLQAVYNPAFVEPAICLLSRPRHYSTQAAAALIINTAAARLACTLEILEAIRNWLSMGNLFKAAFAMQCLAVVHQSHKPSCMLAA